MKRFGGQARWSPVAHRDRPDSRRSQSVDEARIAERGIQWNRPRWSEETTQADDLTATLTCPVCRASAIERILTDRCAYFYECPSCHTVLKPKPGDCCVFCSFGDRLCPFVTAPERSEDAADHSSR